MSGTYILKPTLVDQKNGFWFGYDGAAGFATDNPSLISGANNPAITVGTLHTAGALTLLGGLDNIHVAVSNTNDLIRLSFVGNSCYLDGSGVPISFASLPAGWIPTTVQARMRSSVNAQDATYKVYLQFNALTESPNFVTLPGPSSFSSFNWPSVTMPSALSLFNNGIGLRIDNTTIGQRSSREYLGMMIVGNYDIQSFGWSIETTGSVQSGDEVTIVGDGENSLTDIEEVCLIWDTITICLTEFLVQTPTRLTLIVPSGVNASGFSLTADGVFLGSLVYIFEDASGIYTLTKDKTTDTVYDGAHDGTTNEVKIPNPFIKTGFVND